MTLKEFVTNIANRIRTIRGYPNTEENTKKIKPNDFPDELDEIIKGLQKLFYRGTAYQADYPLTEIVIPEYIEKIGDSVLRSSKLLEKVKILGEVTEIRGSAFQYCEKLKTITTTYSQTENVCALPDTVKDIGGYAFGSAGAMEYFIAPSNLANIGVYAFANCSNCKTFDFSRCKQVPNLGTNAFSNINSNAKILVPVALYNQWVNETNWVTYAKYMECVGELPDWVIQCKVGETINAPQTYGTGMLEFEGEFPEGYLYSIPYYQINNEAPKPCEDYVFPSDVCVDTHWSTPQAVYVGSDDYYDSERNISYTSKYIDMNARMCFLKAGTYQFWCEDPRTNKVIEHKWTFVVTED